jgi:RNA polymerase sigma-70 factor (ECF subfamily)
MSSVIDNTNTGTQDSMATSRSMLGRLIDAEDHATWDTFYLRYRPLVFGFAIKLSLTHEEAEEVCQDVFSEVANSIEEFDKTRGRGTFRRWLFQKTEWRVKDKFRRRQKHVVGIGQLASEDTATCMADRLPAAPELEELWESEWIQRRVEAAVQELSKKVPAKQFQAFELHALQEWPVNRVSRAMGMNPATVYVNTHRMRKLLKQELARIQDEV